MKTALIIFSLMSFSVFAGNKCINLSLKDNVEVCYAIKGQGFVSNSGVKHEGNTNYVIEYECDLIQESTISAIDNGAATGQYRSKTIRTPKGRVSRKFIKNHYSYCMQVADHIEQNKEYPGLLDQADYFGNMIGLGTKEDLKKD